MVFIHVLDPAYPLSESFITELTVVLMNTTVSHLVVRDGLLAGAAPETVATVELGLTPGPHVLFRLQVDGNTVDNTVRLFLGDEVMFVLVNLQLSTGVTLVLTPRALEH